MAISILKKKRPLVTFLKGINLQRTLLLFGISQQLCPIPVLLHYFRLHWVIDELICHFSPHSSELSEHLSWIWVVKCARYHYTGSRETFNWGRYLNWPRWDLSLRRWNKMQITMGISSDSALSKADLKVWHESETLLCASPPLLKKKEISV